MLCCACFSESVDSRKTALDSHDHIHLLTSLSTVHSDTKTTDSNSKTCFTDTEQVIVDNTATPDTEQTLVNDDPLSVASVLTDVVNGSKDIHTESSCWADENMFRVRPRRSKDDSNGGQVQKICEVCGKGFRHYESFRSHKRKHASQPKQSRPARPSLRLMCDVCGLRSKNAAAFARHMQTFHPSTLGIENTGAPYQCQSCEERFYQKRVLHHHTRLVHATNPPRQRTSWVRRCPRPRGSELPSCSYCSRCFATRPALETHERVHTNVKPYRSLQSYFTSENNLICPK